MDEKREQSKSRKGKASGSRFSKKASQSTPVSPRDKNKGFFANIPNFFKLYASDPEHSTSTSKASLLPIKQKRLKNTNSPTVNPLLEAKQNDKGKELASARFSRKSASASAKLSLQLDQLISLDKQPELWRKTLVYEVMGASNKAKIKELSEYPWHTSKSLLSLLNSRWLEPQHEVQKQQVHLLKTLCNELLEPIFQDYLQHAYAREQAEEFGAYLRSCIEQVMTNTLFDEFPPLLNPLVHQYSPHILSNAVEFSDKQFELQLRATMQVRPLRFTEAKAFHPPFDVILPFMCTHIESNQYNALLNELVEQTVLAGSLYRQAQKKTTALRLNLEQGKAPEGYVRLRDILPPNTHFRDEIIEKLATHLHAEMNPNYPKCMNEEVDFFIPQNSVLLASLMEQITDFKQEHKKLQSAKNGSLSTRFVETMSTNLAKQLKDSLLAEKYIEHPPYPLRHNFSN